MLCGVCYIVLNRLIESNKTNNNIEEYIMNKVIISRKDAKANNSKTYFTGIACKNGHIAERYTGNGTCVDCEKIRNHARKGGVVKKIRQVFFSDHSTRNNPVILSDRFFTAV